RVAGPALAAVAAAIDAGLVAVLDAVVAGRRRAVVAAAVGVAGAVGAGVDAAVVARGARRARGAARAGGAGARAAARRAAGTGAAARRAARAGWFVAPDVAAIVRPRTVHSVAGAVTRVGTRLAVTAARRCKQNNQQRTKQIRAHRPPEKKDWRTRESNTGARI